MRITLGTKFLNLLIIFLFVIQIDILLIYSKFDYKLEKSTLINCTRWLP